MPDCTCPAPRRPTGREPEQLPPWECLTCGGFACEYAEVGRTRCPEWRCDCFIDTHPDSPMALHPEDFTVARPKPSPPTRESAWDRTTRQVRSVPCPECGAAVATPCRDLGSPGRALFGNRVHMARAMRLRAYLARDPKT